MRYQTKDEGGGQRFLRWVCTTRRFGGYLGGVGRELRSGEGYGLEERLFSL